MRRHGELWRSCNKEWEGPIMEESTANPSGETFRKFAFVLMVVLIGFGVLELLNVVHI